MTEIQVYLNHFLIQLEIKSAFLDRMERLKTSSKTVFCKSKKFWTSKNLRFSDTTEVVFCWHTVQYVPYVYLSCPLQVLQWQIFMPTMTNFYACTVKFCKTFIIIKIPTAPVHIWLLCQEFSVGIDKNMTVRKKCDLRTTNFKRSANHSWHIFLSLKRFCKGKPSV